MGKTEKLSTNEGREAQKRFKKNSIMLVFQILGIFLATGITAIIVARLISNIVGYHNVVTLLSLGIFYVLSWVIVYFFLAKPSFRKDQKNNNKNKDIED